MARGRGRKKKAAAKPKEAEQAVAKRAPPEPGPMTASAMTKAVQMVREGWSEREIAGHLFVRREEVAIFLSIYEQLRLELSPSETSPAVFSPTDQIREIAADKFVPANVRLAACKALIRESDAQMRIDWPGLRIEDIPETYRPYLAGKLAEYIATEADEEFVEGSQAQRDLFAIVGVLVDSTPDARGLLDRYRRFVDDLRAEAKILQRKNRLQAPTPRYMAEWRDGDEAAAIDVEATEVDG